MTGSGKPKYFILMEQLKKDILSGNVKPGEKLPSEEDLSNIYSMSRHTVRRALGILAQEGYVEIFQGKGTFCSEKRHLTGQSGNIAVVTNHILDPAFPRLIQGMDKVFAENGYSILLKNTGNSRQAEAKYLEELMKKGIGGLIIEPGKSQLAFCHRNLYLNLEKLGIPCVFIRRVYEEMKDKPHILTDDVRGGYLITKYLTDLGHRKIVAFFKADDARGVERHKGYVRALSEAGLSYHTDEVVWFHTGEQGEKCVRAVRKMVENHSLPDGIVCYNDQMAVQVMEMLKEREIRIPEDISVTGYDDSPDALKGCGITTIAYPQEKLGEMAAQLLLEQIQGVPEKESQVERVIFPELIVRGSCTKRWRKR